MWKAIITEVVRDPVPGIALITVSFFKDDVEKRRTSFRISEASAVNRVILNEIRELQRIDDLELFFAAPPIGIELTPEGLTPPPTADEQFLIKKSQMMSELETLKRQADIGMVTKEYYESQRQEKLLDLITNNI